MKRFIYLSIVISACLACTCCSVKDPNDHAICRLYFFDTNGRYPFYYIEVTDSQTVRTTLCMQSLTINLEDKLIYNERLYPYRDSIIADKTRYHYKEYDIDENGEKIWRVERFRQKERRISDNDYAKLKEEIKKVKKMDEINEFENSLHQDAYGYIILIDDRQYIMVDTKGFRDLMRQIMKASPIEILDHSGNPPYFLRQ